VVGAANANDTGFNVELLHHQSTGWTYSPSAFVAGDGEIVDMNTDHVTEKNLVNGEPFAYKRAGLTESVSGSASEGIVVRITTTSNASIQFMDTHLGVQIIE